MKSRTVKQNTFTSSYASLAAFLAIITLVGCGQPATGPLELGGDTARQDLREQARRSGADVSKDTSWLDALVLVDPLFLRTRFRVDVFLANDEGRVLLPSVWLGSAAFKVTDYNAERGVYEKWPSAYYYFDGREPFVDPMRMICDADTLALPLSALPGIRSEGADSISAVLFDPLLDSTITYMSDIYGDSMKCDMNFDGSDSYSSIRDSSWTQLDNGTIVIPYQIRAVMKPDVPNRIYLRRRHYSVTTRSNGKRIGQLLTHRYDGILLTRP